MKYYKNGIDAIDKVCIEAKEKGISYGQLRGIWYEERQRRLREQRRRREETINQKDKPLRYKNMLNEVIR